MLSPYKIMRCDQTARETNQQTQQQHKRKMIDAWYLDDPGKQPIDQKTLENLGYKVFYIEGKQGEQIIDQFSKEYEITMRTFVEISEEKCSKDHLQVLSEEHLHENDEVRLVLDGSGFLDLRDKQDRWIRMHMKKNYLSLVPAGSYHRFSLDDNRMFRAYRLWNEKMVAKRTAFHRADRHTSELSARLEYKQSIGIAPSSSSS